MIQHRSLLKLILLSIITCGIYGIIFWYSYSDDMNRVCQGDGKHTQNFIIVILLNFITCGIYGLIWYYGLGNRLSENAPRYGVSFQENGTTILLWIVVGSLLCGVGTFVAMHILIKNMNILGERYNQMFYSNNTYQQNYNNDFNNQNN